MVFEINLDDFKSYEKQWRNSSLDNAGACLLLSSELYSKISHQEGKLSSPMKIPLYHKLNAILEVFKKITKQEYIKVEQGIDCLIITVGE